MVRWICGRFLVRLPVVEGTAIAMLPTDANCGDHGLAVWRGDATTDVSGQGERERGAEGLGGGADRPGGIEHGDGPVLRISPHGVCAEWS